MRTMRELAAHPGVAAKAVATGAEEFSGIGVYNEETLVLEGKLS